MHKIHPSLIINLDQTGVHLVPCPNKTYAEKGAKSVGVIGAEDRRQFTVVIASSMDGNFLPLQVIFKGTTMKCLPPETLSIVASSIHMTFTENHWSSLETMKEYLIKIIQPYYNQQVELHQLQANTKLLLLLDAWSVHKSEAFRLYIRTHFPWIHLVFVPPNCTSKLQVADVMLQRPFKQGIRNQFNLWMTNTIKNQIEGKEEILVQPYLRMSVIKPLAVEWCIQSWKRMKERRDLICFGWHSCVSSFFNVNDPQKRLQAVEEAAKGELEFVSIPEQDENPQDESESEHEEDEEKDELDIMQERAYGTRRSERKRKQPDSLGYKINSSQIDFVCTASEDSDANGMD